MNKILKDVEIRMNTCVELFKKQLSKVRTDSAYPNLIDGIQIDCYGTLTSLRKIANIVIEDNRILAITIFDPKLLPAVKKAILSSDLGLNPYSTGTLIRIHLPPLSEDRRHQMIKKIRTDAEKSKISIRNIRRDANFHLKTLLKDKSISKDEEHRLQDSVQRLTNIWIKNIENFLEEKEAELIKI